MTDSEKLKVNDNNTVSTTVVTKDPFDGNRLNLPPGGGSDDEPEVSEQSKSLEVIYEMSREDSDMSRSRSSNFASSRITKKHFKQSHNALGNMS